MTKFTDADLKKLKAHYPCGLCPDNDRYIPALIVRLVAAENYILTLRNSNDGLDLAAAERIWKKAAGK